MYVVALDTETTDKDPGKAVIIQIAAIAFEINGKNWREVATFERKVKFDVDVADPEALEKNCYDEDVWAKEAVSSTEAMRDFTTFAKRFNDVERVSKNSGRTFKCTATMGHNLVNYDLPVIRNWYARQKAFCPLDFQMTFDSLGLAKDKIYMEHNIQPKPENLQLETLCAYFGIPLDDAHDAIPDTRAAARLYYHLTHNLNKG